MIGVEDQFIGIGSIGLVFGAGLLASLSPCIYPLLPITVGVFGVHAPSGKVRRVIAYLVGQILAFVALGVVTVAAGETLGFSSEDQWVRVGVGLLLILSGAIAVAGRIPWFPSGIGFARKGKAAAASGIFGAMALGVGSALVASPCTSPILAGVLALLAGNGFVEGVILMFAYSMGFTALFAALGLGLVRLSAFPRAGKWMLHLQKAGGVALVAAGAYQLFR